MPYMAKDTSPIHGTEPWHEYIPDAASRNMPAIMHTPGRKHPNKSGNTAGIRLHPAKGKAGYLP